MSPVLSWVRVGSATSTTSGSLVVVVNKGASDSVEGSECSETAGLGLLVLFVVFLLCLGIINFNIQLKLKNMMKTVLMVSCGETVTD